MKKTLSLIITLVMLLTSFYALSSCSTTAEDQLIGVWEYELYTSKGALLASSTYTFSKNGDQYKAVYSAKSYGSTNTFESSYKIDGSKIIFTLSNGNTIDESYTLNGNTLTIGKLEFKRK